MGAWKLNQKISFRLHLWDFPSNCRSRRIWISYVAMLNIAGGSQAVLGVYARRRSYGRTSRSARAGLARRCVRIFPPITFFFFPVLNFSPKVVSWGLPSKKMLRLDASILRVKRAMLQQDVWRARAFEYNAYESFGGTRREFVVGLFLRKSEKIFHFDRIIGRIVADLRYLLKLKRLGFQRTRKLTENTRRVCNGCEWNGAF